MKKNILVLTLRSFVSDVISEVGFWPFWLMLPGLGPEPLDRCISLKYSLQSTLEFQSFEPLINFLAFRVQK